MDCILSVVDEGTELQALLASTTGTVLDFVRVPGPSRPAQDGAAALRRKLEHVVRKLLGERDVICLAAAVSLPEDPERLRQMLADLVPTDGERVCPIAIERCLLAGALGTPYPTQAIVVRADVGSGGFGVGVRDREALRGGFGEILGDEGSAYWIGREGIRLAIRAHERRFRNTLLKSRLMVHFGLTSYRELAVTVADASALDRFAIAGFAPQVFEAAQHDDEVAIGILDEAGRDLAVLALALVSDLDLGSEPFSVLPAGSVFRQRGPCLEAFMKMLRNRTTKAAFVGEGMGAAAGALLLGLSSLGLKVRPDTVETLRATLKAHS